ncbi:MAG: deoxyribonuclease IV [Luteitalea sp.]|nr:deoxyribonuclease IV [Luteitalea sp.]
MPYLGAHLSISGGFPRAVDRAQAAHCEALQVFTKSVGQWRARVLAADEVRMFRARVDEVRLAAVVGHTSYLINIAAADPMLRARSVEALAEELDRAEALGLFGLVMHPGSHVREQQGLRLIARALAQLLRARPRGRTMILLEHTAGQGTNLGHRFEHLATVLEYLNGSSRVGVCLDTCHLLAAGYDIGRERGYRETFRTFDRLVGLDRIRIFHLNDSVKPRGSRIDRHAHIGQGCIGIEAFRRLLNDRRFARLPMVIETAKHPRLPRGATVDPLDAMNLATLRGLLAPGKTENGDVSYNDADADDG